MNPNQKTVMKVQQPLDILDNIIFQILKSLKTYLI